MIHETTTLKPISPPLKRLKPPPHHHQDAAAEVEVEVEVEVEEQPLIPGVPDHIAQLCLSHIHPSLLFSVSHSWRRLIYSSSYPSYLSLYVLFSSKSDPNQTHFLNFDPVFSNWEALPLPPPPSIRFLVLHPSYISRNLPIQTLSVSGNLILLAATSPNLAPAFSRPLIFNPSSRSWSSGPAIPSPRRWCVTGAARGSVYVASGIGTNFSTDVSRSVEKLDMKRSARLLRNGNRRNESEWRWEKMRGLKDGRFSRDAINGVGWRGKICMVNVEGDSPKEGIVYDVETDEWKNMPEGMVGGWKGYVTAMDEEVMYMVVDGLLRKYDEERDDWKEVIIESELLRGAQQISAGGGRVCVITDAGRIIVVDVVAPPPRRLVVVEAPSGFLQPLAVHILPRMNR